MRDWSLTRVVGVGAAYVLACVVVSVAVTYWRLPNERGPGGHWKVFVLVPPTWALYYLVAVFLPPLLLLLGWLARRDRAA